MVANISQCKEAAEEYSSQCISVAKPTVLLMKTIVVIKMFFTKVDEELYHQ